MHYTTVTPGNLDRLTKNFSNLANAFSDDSSDDNGHDYLSYMNISQSPEEFYKRLRHHSKEYQYPDSVSAAGQSGNAGIISGTKQKEPMIAMKKKSILKKSSSNQVVKEKSMY